MSLFEQLGNNSPAERNSNPAQALQQLRANPGEYLRKSGLNIPDGLNDPQQIINHLLSSGQVSQGRYSQAIQMLRGNRR